MDHAIYLPPLRQRLDDMEMLADHFLKSYSGKYRKPYKKIGNATIERLKTYHWPGNIRELQHAIERAVIMSESGDLKPDDFFFLSNKEDSGGGTSLDTFNLDSMEKTMIQKAISRHGGNISKAAKELGLTRTSLYRRLEKHGL